MENFILYKLFLYFLLIGNYSFSMHFFQKLVRYKILGRSYSASSISSNEYFVNRQAWHEISLRLDRFIIRLNYLCTEKKLKELRQFLKYGEVLIDYFEKNPGDNKSDVDLCRVYLYELQNKLKEQM